MHDARALISDLAMRLPLKETATEAEKLSTFVYVASHLACVAVDCCPEDMLVSVPFSLISSEADVP